MQWFGRAAKTNFNERLLAIHHWLESGDSDFLLKAERQQLEQELHYIFGYHGCQMTIAPGKGLLDSSQVGKLSLLNPSPAMTRTICDSVTRDSGSVILADPFNWPVSQGSLDLVFLHHVMEFSDRPHRLLSEAARTIIPGGKLIIIGFNPRSLVNLSRYIFPRRRRLFQDSHLISAHRLRDWLTLLGFNVERISYGAYLHPLDKHSRGLTSEMVEQRCRHWQLPLGGFYLMVATLETPGMTPIKPFWPEVGRRFVSNPIAGTSPRVSRDIGENC